MKGKSLQSSFTSVANGIKCSCPLSACSRGSRLSEENLEAFSAEILPLQSTKGYVSQAEDRAQETAGYWGEDGECQKEGPPHSSS